MLTPTQAPRGAAPEQSCHYVDHWHGDIAIFSDGQAYRIGGHGWLTTTEAREMIRRICQGHVCSALRISDHA